MLFASPREERSEILLRFQTFKKSRIPATNHLSALCSSFLTRANLFWYSPHAFISIESKNSESIDVIFFLFIGYTQEAFEPAGSSSLVRKPHSKTWPYLSIRKLDSSGILVMNLKIALWLVHNSVLIHVCALSAITQMHLMFDRRFSGECVVGRQILSFFWDWHLWFCSGDLTFNLLLDLMLCHFKPFILIVPVNHREKFASLAKA